MSYVVLARKYRPRRFSEMVGQDAVVTALTHALEQQRLHHAYLFTGTRGIGKTTVSRILAKSLNCSGVDGQGGITATPCGVCGACTEIDADRYIDYIELDAASNRGIDEIRDLLERAAYKPSVGHFKIFMIDEAHQLTKDSFNALLKTLEEPPEYLKFVLATTDPDKMLPTVLSRCLQFNLRPMAGETVAAHLQQVLAAENVRHDEASIRLLARAARGSMRDALSLTDQAIAYGNGALAEAGVRQMLGSADRGHVFGLIEALAQGDGRSVVETAEALRRDGLSAASTLEEMTTVLQAMAVVQAVPARGEDGDAADPDALETARLAALMPADETQLLYSICLHGRGELGLAPDEYAALTMVLLRLLAFKPPEKKTLTEPRAEAPRAAPPPMATEAASPPGQRLPVRSPPQVPPSMADRPAAHVDTAQAATKIVAVPLRVQAPAGPREAARADEAAAPIAPSEEGDFWHATVSQMVAAEAITAMARELALQSQLVARDVDQWLLRVERESLNQPASRDKLRAALAALGHEVAIAIEVGMVVDSPARRNKQAADARQRAAEEAIRNDPEVQALMRDFDARIVPGTLRPA